MANMVPEMVDVMFDLEGGALPADYPFALWAEIVRHAPQLANEEFVGVLPLRTSEGAEGLLLAKRARLVLRLPARFAEYAVTRLSGQELDMSADGQPGRGSLRLGQGKLHEILPYPTIHAQLVTGAHDELAFTDQISAQLKKMGIAAKLICGRPRALEGRRHTIHGFSLAIHDLKPEASLQLQYAGLGEARHFGCGLFVPHKTISGL